MYEPANPPESSCNLHAARLVCDQRRNGPPGHASPSTVAAAGTFAGDSSEGEPQRATPAPALTRCPLFRRERRCFPWNVKPAADMCRGSCGCARQSSFRCRVRAMRPLGRQGCMASENRLLRRGGRFGCVSMEPSIVLRGGARIFRPRDLLFRDGRLGGLRKRGSGKDAARLSPWRGRVHSTGVGIAKLAVHFGSSNL